MDTQTCNGLLYSLIRQLVEDKYVWLRWTSIGPEPTLRIYTGIGENFKQRAEISEESLTAEEAAHLASYLGLEQTMGASGSFMDDMYEWRTPKVIFVLVDDGSRAASLLEDELLRLHIPYSKQPGNAGGLTSNNGPLACPLTDMMTALDYFFHYGVPYGLWTPGSGAP